MTPRLVVTLLLVASSPAAADPVLAEEVGDNVQLAAGAGSTFLVGTDGTKHQRIRIYDLATRAWKSVTYDVRPELRALLVDGATYFGATSDGAGAVYSLDGKAVTVAGGKPFRSIPRQVAQGRPLVAVAGTRDGTVYAFDGKTTRSLDLALQNEDGGVGRTSAVAFSSDGKRLAVGTTAHYAFEIDVASWKVSRLVVHDESSINALAYSRDNRTLVVGTDYGMLVFDVASGKRMDGPKKAPESRVAAIAYSPDGAYVAVGGREAAIRLYSTTTWKQKAMLSGHFAEVTALAWSTDGKFLASGAGSELRIWAPLE